MYNTKHSQSATKMHTVNFGISQLICCKISLISQYSKTICIIFLKPRCRLGIAEAGAASSASFFAGVCSFAARGASNMQMKLTNQ